MNYQTIRVRSKDSICFLQLFRPERNNTINDLMIDECRQVLEACEEAATIVVIEGLPDVFCFGADFEAIEQSTANREPASHDPEPLYRLWSALSTGPFITIAHVKGKANAGGIGFVAACDIVLADETAQFSLSELLFGLLPACVLPFLIRRTGFQCAHHMTLLTQPVSVAQAHAWRLVDAFDKQSDLLLRKYLARMRRISKPAIRRYKDYMNELDSSIPLKMPAALAANRDVFSDLRNLVGIARYIQTGLFPWQS